VEAPATALGPPTPAARLLLQRERELAPLATLAAEGQTNRDIARILYVTPKTVEVHLSSAYRKLGIRSGQQLAGELAAP
jgi:DNA-binding NarL/FixJ family response regulator